MTTGVNSGWIGDYSGLLYHQSTKIEKLMESLIVALEKVVANQEKMVSILK
jgi:hypothetical protein